MIETRFKDTEAGRIPEDWEVINVGKNFFLKGRIGWQGLKANEFKQHGPFLVTGTDFINGKIDWKKCYHITLQRYLQDQKLQVKSGDVLITKDGTIGKLAYIDDVPGLVSLNSHLLIIRPFDTNIIDNHYIFYHLKGRNFSDYVDIAQTGTTMASLTQEKVAKYNLPLPPLEEQSRIASALTSIENLISSIDILIEKKRAIKQGAMQQLLTGKKRLKGFTEPWVEKKLGAISSIYDGTHQTPHYVDNGVPFYSVENVTANDFVNTKYISEKEHELLSSRVKIEQGDVLMTRIGSIGKCKYIDWKPKASFYVSLALIKCVDSVDSKFISYYSNSKQFRNEIELRSLFMAIPQKINLGPISEILMIIPPSRKEQSAIASVLSSMDEEISALESKKVKYEYIKQGLMQQLLTGKIRLID